MTTPSCIYALIHAPHERLEPLLLDGLAPLAHEWRDAPELDSLFFVRYSEPRWQLRFRVLGEPAWIAGTVRARLDERLASLLSAGIESYVFATYDREVERYGGPRGMALAEQLFTADSFAALALCAADRAGALRKSRREVALVLVERWVDAAGFTPAQKVAFYRRGYSWALEHGDWNETQVRQLEARYQALRPGLERLFGGAAPLASDELWGGPAAATIGDSFLAEAAPILRRIRDAHAAGTIAQDLVYLFWSYTHMFTNRIGIEAGPEAILRYFMHRFHADRQPVAH